MTTYPYTKQEREVLFLKNSDGLFRLAGKVVEKKSRMKPLPVITNAATYEPVEVRPGVWRFKRKMQKSG